MDIYKSVDKAEVLQQGKRQHSDKYVSKTVMKLTINVVNSMNRGAHVNF